MAHVSELTFRVGERPIREDHELPMVALNRALVVRRSGDSPFTGLGDSNRLLEHQVRRGCLVPYCRLWWEMEVGNEQLRVFGVVVEFSSSQPQLPQRLIHKGTTLLAAGGLSFVF